ncbi:MULTISPECIES: hypothetical protein [Aeromonas]|uniref:Uncharacterized protein n=1 Tax=Aeromonas veronii TaxID=654 RepID=A0A4S5CJS9_AERVE|nr:MULTISPECIES: hypothetical protein [Aeromonas]THJ43608.1 hypothetical protein E8Q35_14980 [Aeromonas veronii]
MNSNIAQPIVFIDNKINALSARVDDKEISINFDEDGYLTGASIFHYRRAIVPPCHDEYFDEPNCPGNKCLDDVEDFDACTTTCPYLTEGEQPAGFTAIMGNGESYSELASEIKRCLLDHNFNNDPTSESTIAFISRDWIVDDELIKGTPLP